MIHHKILLHFYHNLSTLDLDAVELLTVFFLISTC